MPRAFEFCNLGLGFILIVETRKAMEAAFAAQH